MNARKVLEVLVLYRLKFIDLEVGKIDYPHAEFLPLQGLRNLALAHCHGMISQIEDFVATDRMEKVFRWLGFIQGVLWVLRVYTLEELKSHNRPAE